MSRYTHKQLKQAFELGYAYRNEEILQETFTYSVENNCPIQPLTLVESAKGDIHIDDEYGTYRVGQNGRLGVKS